MSGFKSFSELAQELQDQIWDMAIRPDEPAAQFFTIYDTSRGGTAPDGPQTERNGGVTPDPCWSPVGLTAPPRPTDGVRSWADGNRSAYMADSGLWTACRASRARMLRRFRPAETSALISRLGAPVSPEAALEVCRRPTASATMPFRRDNGERQYLTIKPTQDLLYFDFAAGCGPAPGSDADNGCWKPLADVPAFRWRRRRLPDNHQRGWDSPFHVRHIAIAYDPGWRGSRAGFQVQVGPRAGDVAGLEVFWLVDYSLRRRYRADFDSSRRERLTFRAGDDHEFVEVLETDDEWWGPSSSGSNGDVDGKGKSGDDGVMDREGRSGAHDLTRDMEERVYMERIMAEMDDLDSEREAQQSNIVHNYDNNLGDDDDSEDDDWGGNGSDRGDSQDDNDSISWDFAAASQGKSGAHDLAREMEEDVYLDSMVAQMEALDAEREAHQNNIVNHNNYESNPGDDDDDSEGDDSEDDDQGIPWDSAAEDDDDARTRQHGPAHQTPFRFGVLAYVKRGSERDLPRRHESLQEKYL